MHHIIIHGLVNIIPISPASDFSAIGKLLIPPISASKVAESLNLLTSLGLIRPDKNGNFELTETMLSTGNNPPDITLRKFLKDGLARAQEAVDGVPVSERACSLLTISVSKKCFQKIKEKLAAVRKEINEIIAQDTDLGRVYQLGMYCIPFTKTINKEDDNA